MTYLLTELNGNSFIIFGTTCANVMKVTLMLRDLGFDAVCLHGQMSQVGWDGSWGVLIASCAYA